jgi:3-dehydroquinate dehydratase / shikimate dehydrogenase
MEIIASYVPDPGHEPGDELQRPPAAATMVELRADLLPPDVDLAALVAASRLPVVLTLRSVAEGGRGPDDASARRAFFTAAARLPVAFFDLEANRDAALLGGTVPRERAIASLHILDGVPADLEERARACLATGARLAKIVPTASNLADVLAVLRLARGCGRGDPGSRRGLVFAMGEAGRATRLLGPLLAAPVAFAAWDGTRTAALGQFEAGELQRLIGHLEGRPRRLFAVVGSTVGASLSPRMHAAAYRAVGLANLFVPIEVSAEEELDVLIAPAGQSSLDALGLALGGLAVTMPWKEAAARRCTVVAPRAARARAVNTVLPWGGKIFGDCTDMDGITGVIRDAGVGTDGARALVLGAGGAARAASVALELAGCRVALAARDPAKARTAAASLGVTMAEVSEPGSSIVVNATPAGADGEAGAWLERLAAPRGALVVDLPYGAVTTGLERLAAERGWDYVSGREVLLFQGISQFAAMNQVAPPVRAMAAALGLDEVQG